MMRALWGVGLAVVLLSFSPALPAVEPAPPRLDGWWAGLQITTALVDLPVLGALEAETTVLSLIRIEQRGLDLVVDERVCRIDSDVPGPVETRYPPAFLRAISERGKVARLVASDGAHRFEEPLRSRLLGVALDDPDRDPIPRVPEDPRILDADRDGKPGLTVEVSGLANGRLYVAQRDRSRRSGVVVSPNRIEGVSFWESEQVVLGATSVMLESPPNARPHPDPARSPFVLERLLGPISCRQLVSSSPPLLRGRWEELPVPSSRPARDE